MQRFVILAICGCIGNAACFNPEPPANLPCSSRGLCPPGQTCHTADNICYPLSQTPQPIDAGEGGSPDSNVDPVLDAGPAPDAKPVPASCSNLMRDGTETDVDCGGSVCGACADAKQCIVSDDCISGVCGANLRCTPARCGDGVVNGDDECDDSGESATCDADCTNLACGDSTVNMTAGEECDDGPDNSDTPNACRTTCKLPTCGDNIVDNGENVDPPLSPSPIVPVDINTCRFDLSGVRQMYCQGNCGTVWDGTPDCQDSDADVLCKLITGNPNSQATDFVVQSTLENPGVCCPPPALADPSELSCVALGNMSDRGVNVDISIHETNMRSTHGTGGVVVIQSLADCTNP